MGVWVIVRSIPGNASLARCKVGSHCPSPIWVVAIMDFLSVEGAEAEDPPPDAAGAAPGAAGAAQAGSNNNADAVPATCKNARRLIFIRGLLVDMKAPLLISLELIVECRTDKEL